MTEVIDHFDCLYPSIDNLERVHKNIDEGYSDEEFASQVLVIRIINKVTEDKECVHCHENTAFIEDFQIISAF